MTIISQRYCGNCVHFLEGEGGCPHRCQHPARQEVSTIQISVRKHELACRTTWTGDLWEQRVLHIDEPTVKMKDIIIWSSVPSNLATDELPDDLLELLVYLASDEKVDLREWLAAE
jgi:hypothetical protein